MGNAAHPDGPEGRWDRLANALLVVAVVFVVGLLVVSLLDAYVF